MPVNTGLYLSQTQLLFRKSREFFIGIFYARRAAFISFIRAHSVFVSPDDFMAASISAYSGGDMEQQQLC
jgi:hypothetical protein